MTDDTVTLAFIARRLDAIQSELRNGFEQLRSESIVHTGMAQRVEGAVLGLTTEIAGLRKMMLAHDQRLRQLEQ